MASYITAEIETFVYEDENRKKYTDDLEEAISALFKKAAKAFLVEALDRIPIRTGFLAGAFRVLADAVGEGIGTTQIDYLLRKHHELEEKQRTLVHLHNANVEELNNKVKELEHLEANVAKLTREHERLMEKVRVAKQRGDLRTLNLLLLKGGEGGVIGRIATQLHQLKSTSVKARTKDIERINRRIEKLNQRLEKTKGESEKTFEKMKKKSFEIHMHEQRTGPEHLISEAKSRAQATLRMFKLKGLEAGMGGPFELYKHTDGTYTIKTASSGTKFAKLTGFPAREVNNKFDINFSVDIIYLSVNDEKYGWQSWNAGSEAFTKVLQDGLIKLPNIVDYLSKVRYSLSKAGNISVTKIK